MRYGVDKSIHPSTHRKITHAAIFNPAESEEHDASVFRRRLHHQNNTIPNPDTTVNIHAAQISPFQPAAAALVAGGAPAPSPVVVAAELPGVLVRDAMSADVASAGVGRDNVAESMEKEYLASSLAVA